MAASIENNELKTIGVKPALDQGSIRTYPRRFSDYTQVNAFNYANNTDVPVYTVPTGKTLYLVSFNASFDNEAGAARIGYTRILTGAAAIWWLLSFSSLTNTGSDNHGFSFSVPLEVPAGYVFAAFSGGADAVQYLSISGYLI